MTPEVAAQIKKQLEEAINKPNLLLLYLKGKSR